MADFASERATRPRPLRAGLAVGAVALAGVTFGPWLALALGVEVGGWEAFVRAASRPFCHQAPGRSLDVAGHLLPLCARCTGMWLGITLGVAVGLLWPPRRRWPGIALGVVALGLSFADALREHLIHVGSWGLRLTLGFVLCAAPLGAITADLLALLQRAGRRLRPSARA
jgi:uncharacterized membrane protein